MAKRQPPWMRYWISTSISESYRTVIASLVLYQWPHTNWVSTINGDMVHKWHRSLIVAFAGRDIIIVCPIKYAHGFVLCRFDVENSSLLVCSFRSYTTIENPSYFFMTLSCTEAIQSFISHFNQYSLVDPSWGNIPSWVWQGVSHWFRKLRRRVWHHCHFGNWISWK